MKRTYIIAEIAWGHDGSKKQALELVKAAKKSGADGISIHITDLPTYMVPYYGSGEGKVSKGREHLEVYNYLQDINISNNDWIEICEVIKKEKLDLCIMPNDLASLKFSEEVLKPEFYVISAAGFVEKEFVKEVAKLNKKTLFRIGGAYLGEIEDALNIFYKEKNSNIILLHGFQNYPTKLEETNLALLASLKNIFGVEVGLADHIDGGSDLAKIIPILALSYGATYIEKHITLDRDEKSEDFESALDPKAFEEMVNYVRAAEIAIGESKLKGLSDATIRYRNISRKRIVASRKINEGEVIDKNSICFMRSDIGLTPDKTDVIIGRKAKSEIRKNDSITNEMLG